MSEKETCITCVYSEDFDSNGKKLRNVLGNYYVSCNHKDYGGKVDIAPCLSYERRPNGLRCDDCSMKLKECFHILNNVYGKNREMCNGNYGVPKSKKLAFLKDLQPKGENKMTENETEELRSRIIAIEETFKKIDRIIFDDSTDRCNKERLFLKRIEDIETRLDDVQKAVIPDEEEKKEMTDVIDTFKTFKTCIYCRPKDFHGTRTRQFTEKVYDYCVDCGHKTRDLFERIYCPECREKQYILVPYNFSSRKIQPDFHCEKCGTKIKPKNIIKDEIKKFKKLDKKEKSRKSEIKSGKGNNDIGAWIGVIALMIFWLIMGYISGIFLLSI
jgi:hypothetical protein